MRLLLDEMFSPLIAAELRARGHDVQAICGSAHEALADAGVLGLARAERRALVTNNLVDFRPLHADAIAPGGDGHHGMVFVPGAFRRTKADVGRIVNALEAVLDRHPGDGSLIDAEEWLS